MDGKKESGGENKNPKEDAVGGKQTEYVVIFMAVLIVSLFAVFLYAQQDDKIIYNGIEFNKEKEGSLTFYKSLLGYVTSSGEEIPFILKLRTNPEELAKIPVKGKINLLDDAIITLSPAVAECPNTYITLLDMSITLNAFGITPTAATNDLNYSIEKNVTLADCRSSLNKTVILFQEGQENKIDQNRILRNCYVIDVKECQIREDYERFILSYIIDSMINESE